MWVLSPFSIRKLSRVRDDRPLSPARGPGVWYIIYYMYEGLSWNLCIFFSLFTSGYLCFWMPTRLPSLFMFPFLPPLPRQAGIRLFSSTVRHLDRAIVYPENGNSAKVLTYSSLAPPPPNSVNIRFLPPMATVVDALKSQVDRLSLEVHSLKAETRAQDISIGNYLLARLSQLRVTVRTLPRSSYLGWTTCTDNFWFTWWF